MNVRITRNRSTVLFIATLLACGTSPSRPHTSRTPGSLRGKQPPPELESLESGLEDAGEAARASNWNDAADRIARASSSWTALRPRVIGDGAPSSGVASIDDLVGRALRDVAARDAHATESDANAAGRLLADLFDLYAQRVPSDVLRLDVAFRGAEIGGEYADWQEIAARVEEARATWARLRKVIQSRLRTSDPNVAERIEDAISRIAKAHADKDLTSVMKATEDALERVDDLEKSFR